MIKLIKTSNTQNQMSARKRHTFDFQPSHMEEKTAKSQQKFQNNYFSKMEKGQCCNIDLKLNIPSVHLLNKKEVRL